jgi:phosphoribosyl-AMP cyclohydrolase
MIIETDMKTESIFQVTFTNSSSVFIKAMDEGHARRIVEKNGSTWTRGEHSVEMVIKEIKLMSR